MLAPAVSVAVKLSPFAASTPLLSVTPAGNTRSVPVKSVTFSLKFTVTVVLGVRASRAAHLPSVIPVTLNGATVAPVTVTVRLACAVAPLPSLTA